MSAIGLKMLEEARKELGTPFCLGGRASKVGLDCGGLILVAALGAGLPVQAKSWDRKAFEAFVGRFCESADLPGVGDLLLFEKSSSGFHLGLCSGIDLMIHAWDGAAIRQVRETPIRPWSRWLAGCYRFREALV